MGKNHSKRSQNAERQLTRGTYNVRMPQRQLSDTPDPQAASVTDKTVKQRVQYDTLDSQAASVRDMTMKQRVDSDIPDQLSSSSGIKVKPCEKCVNKRKYELTKPIICC